MLYLAQVNFGVNLASLVGIISVLFGGFYFIFVIVWLLKNANTLNSLTMTLYILQVIFVPIIMLLCGLILIFQGWRLDPILLFEQTLLFGLTIYLVIKDIVINTVYRNR